jgi:hypothetical protein
MNTTTRYQIVERNCRGLLLWSVAGLGRNRGTWDSTCSSRSTARRWLRQLRKEFPLRHWHIETSV